MTPAQIQNALENALPDCTAEVASADQRHYEAVVVSSAFAGKRPLQRHQLVYQAIGESVGREIHALSIKAYTPEEWAARSA